MMKDITDPRLLYAKAGLFLLAGVLASTIILLEHPSLKVAGLLAVCVWCFARAYYFAFHVVEHYVDGDFRYAGLLHFVRYALGARKSEDP